MRDALSNVLVQQDVDPGVDRILASAFFGCRPGTARTSARVIVLADRRQAATSREADQ